MVQFELLKDDKMIMITHEGKQVSALFIQRFYQSYFKEVFYKVEKSAGQKFIFSLQKVTQIKKEPIYSIRVESMRNRHLNTTCHIPKYLGNHIISQHSNKTFSFLDLFTLERSPLKLKIKKHVTKRIAENILYNLLKRRMYILKNRKNNIEVTYGKKYKYGKNPQNNEFFSLIHDKRTNTYFACLDTIYSSEPNEDVLSCKAPLSRLQHKMILEIAHDSSQFDFNQYQIIQKFEVNMRQKSMRLHESAENEIKLAIAKYFLAKMTSFKRLRQKAHREVCLKSTMVFQGDNSIIVAFIVKYLKKNYTEIRFEKIHCFNNKYLKKVRKNYLARLTIDDFLAQHITDLSKERVNKSDPKKSFLLKFFKLDQQNMNVSLRNKSQELSNRVLFTWRQKFIDNEEPLEFELKASYKRSTNSILFSAFQGNTQYNDYEVLLKNRYESEEQLIKTAREVSKRILIKDGQLQEIDEFDEPLTPIIEEIIEQKQEFCIRTFGKDGKALLVYGECHIVKQGNTQSILLFQRKINSNSTSKGQVQFPLVLQQRVRLGKLNDMQTEQLQKNFELIVKMNISSNKDLLSFDNINHFTDPLSLQFCQISIQ